MTSDDLLLALGKEDVLTRKRCAVIIHRYLQETLKEKDVINIERAYKIKDLFDCRICANHIAQVVLKGIMDVRKYPGDILMFELEKEVVPEEISNIVKRTVDLKERKDPAIWGL